MRDKYVEWTYITIKFDFGERERERERERDRERYTRSPIPPTGGPPGQPSRLVSGRSVHKIAPN